jgi:thymidylate kinase
MDFLDYSDYYEGFVDYQQRMLSTFDELSDEFDFCDVDATRPIHEVFRDLRDQVWDEIKELKPTYMAAGDGGGQPPEFLPET